MAPFGAQQRFRRDIERVVPRYRREFGASFAALTTQRRQQSILVVNPLGVPRDLGTDHAGRVTVVRGPAYSADGTSVEDLHIERTSGRTVVWAGGRADSTCGLGVPHGVVH